MVVVADTFRSPVLGRTRTVPETNFITKLTTDQSMMADAVSDVGNDEKSVSPRVVR